jgi:integrase/recombinase XerD
MARALRLHLGERTGGYLFESARLDRYSARRVQQVVRAVADEAGIEKRVHPHKLRHTMAKRLRDGGMPVDLLKEMLGHNSVKTTEHYYGTSTARVRDAFDEATDSGG